MILVDAQRATLIFDLIDIDPYVMNGVAFDGTRHAPSLQVSQSACSRVLYEKTVISAIEVDLMFSVKTISLNQ